jgi:hypothetical protein
MKKLLLLLCLTYSVNTFAQVPGCTDPVACNYDALATVDNGSCNFPDGCTDTLASNFDAAAT